MTEKRKNYDAIIAWANGEPIQQYWADCWHDVDEDVTPDFTDGEFRVVSYHEFAVSMKNEDGAEMIMLCNDAGVQKNMRMVFDKYGNLIDAYTIGATGTEL